MLLGTFSRVCSNSSQKVQKNQDSRAFLMEEIEHAEGRQEINEYYGGENEPDKEKDDGDKEKDDDIEKEKGKKKSKKKRPVHTDSEDEDADNDIPMKEKKSGHGGSRVGAGRKKSRPVEAEGAGGAGGGGSSPPQIYGWDPDNISRIPKGTPCSLSILRVVTTGQEQISHICSSRMFSFSFETWTKMCKWAYIQVSIVQDDLNKITAKFQVSEQKAVIVFGVVQYSIPFTLSHDSIEGVGMGNTKNKKK